MNTTQITTFKLTGSWTEGDAEFVSCTDPRAADILKAAQTHAMQMGFDGDIEQVENVEAPEVDFEELCTLIGFDSEEDALQYKAQMDWFVRSCREMDF